MIRTSRELQADNDDYHEPGMPQPHHHSSQQTEATVSKATMPLRAHPVTARSECLQSVARMDGGQSILLLDKKQEFLSSHLAFAPEEKNYSCRDNSAGHP